MEKKIRNIIVVLIIVFNSNANAQTESLISSNGNAKRINNITIDWSIGETLTSTTSENSIILIEGFHQPYIIRPQTSKPEFNNFPFVLYPNPTRTVLQINRKAKHAGSVHYTIYNLLGQLVDSDISSTNPTRINTANFSSGIYILYLWDVDFNYIGSKNFVKL